MNEKGTKWTLNQAIEAGKESVILANTYHTDIEMRLEPDELKQHEANVAELARRRSGQKENVADMKSNTEKQADVILKINDMAIGIHNMVRSKNPSPEISNAFGIGVRIFLTVGGVTAGANIIMDGYRKYPEWSRKAGILEADITKLSAMLTNLHTVERLQDDSMFTKKAQTMSKNELQREVEDEVTHLSSIGAFVFHDVDPGISRLFEDLIPSA